MRTRRVLVEIAVDSVGDALAAVEAGADRLELCAALREHGLTPGRDLIASVAGRVRTVAMARPAPGSVHDGASWRRTIDDARAVIGAGAGGMVFGCLTPRGGIDRPRVEQMVELARGAGHEAVFHRAIDLAADPLAALHELAGLGVSRVLTAGLSGARTAHELAEPAADWPRDPAWHGGGDDWARRFRRLAALVDAARGRVEVLVGGGVRAGNAREIVALTGCTQIHSSARVGPAAAFSAGEARALIESIK